jgi:hypothetical protein
MTSAPAGEVPMGQGNDLAGYKEYMLSPNHISCCCCYDRVLVHDSENSHRDTLNDSCCSGLLWSQDGKRMGHLKTERVTGGHAFVLRDSSRNIIGSCGRERIAGKWHLSLSVNNKNYRVRLTACGSTKHRMFLDEDGNVAVELHHSCCGPAKVKARADIPQAAILLLAMF